MQREAPDSDDGIQIHREDEAPCPMCGCPFLYERLFFRSEERSLAWRDQDGEWYCGPLIELVEVGCMAVGCDWTSIDRFKYGKKVGGTPDIIFDEEGGEFHGFEA